ncbi:MAG TPA: cytochrome c [Candidatus Binatia bacterium]|nr:cytochrome c [Candidatus Binatia bacterium]
MLFLSRYPDPGGKAFVLEAGGVGPDLTGYSALPKEYLAGYVVKEGKASMGNYNHFMTIQEMIDLVAFLRHGTDAKRK